MTAREVKIPLPWKSPPLSLNDRRGHWAHAKVVDEVRQIGGWLAKQHRLGGPYRHVTVTLHYRPARGGVIDDENSVPTLKALADGLVDAKLVEDDDRTRMTKNMPVIHDATGPPGQMWLIVEISATGEEAA